jgi:hypothetical protein
MLHACLTSILYLLIKVLQKKKKTMQLGSIWFKNFNCIKYIQSKHLLEMLKTLNVISFCKITTLNNKINAKYIEEVKITIYRE